MTPSAVTGIFESEMAKISQPEVRKLLRTLAITPRVEEREWDYGKPGETFPCWFVLEHTPSNTGIAYCKFGFGPTCPWGLLFLKGPHLSMGMDAAWYSDLETAVRESMAWDGPNPSGYEIQ